MWARPLSVPGAIIPPACMEPSQSSSSAVAGGFSKPCSLEQVKTRQAGFQEGLRQTGKVEANYADHFLAVRKRDVVAEAAAQEGVRQLPLGIAGDDDNRPLFGDHFMVDLPNDE